ncbi:histidinol-phosphate aminotransferase [Oceaniovalibus guishaninsula JLT2003]|uniref:histidinol-phosphate transaminase n=1 Tax=Oceaniovalibus guishaninsula JLT2003 TaxID=1231392 RepID=K2I522_9RHOB|nr:pyridoxal phosphate-dependent aminotransferase [Oceaniovalibus guishaninsula]EKE44020.1 histidinol-phosphate aminotransferase [Oceaniovalibus guishaninsula JLT2003]
MTDPRLTPLAAALPATVPFVGPETLERRRGAPFAARLGANENGFGPSPQALEALQKAAPDAWMYPDPECHELKTALAAHHGLDAEHIVVGEGIDGLLGWLVRLTVAPGTTVVTSSGAYPTFDYHVTGYGGTLSKVPYRDDKEDPQALIARAAETGARLIYLANPDNPTGSVHDAATVERMVAAVPDGALLILDEAYLGCDAGTPHPCIVPDDPRVIRMRTFSKAYGLAGLRIGYAIGPKPLIAAFDRVRNHFGVARMSQDAALAALADDAWLAEVQTRIAASRDRIADIAERAGMTPLPSVTNFVACDCGDAARAGQVMDCLEAAGIFARRPGTPPLDRLVRISCGPEADMALLERALLG